MLDRLLHSARRITTERASTGQLYDSTNSHSIPDFQLSIPRPTAAVDLPSSRVIDIVAYVIRITGIRMDEDKTHTALHITGVRSVPQVVRESGNE